MTSPKDNTERRKRTAFEQQEYQRQNPHLFTTLSQCVNADGGLTTFDCVTHKVQEAMAKLQGYHRQQFTGPHPDYCMKGTESDVCKMIEYYQEELDKVRGTFVRNYYYIRERGRSAITAERRRLDV